MTPEQTHVIGMSRYSSIAFPGYLDGIDKRTSCGGSIRQNFGPRRDARLLLELVDLYFREAPRPADAAPAFRQIDLVA